MTWKTTLGAAAIATTLAVSTSAFAQTQGECRTMFVSADINGDGILNSVELTAFDRLPDALAEQNEITWAEFLDECAD